MPILIKLLPAVNISYEDSRFHNAGNYLLNIYEDKIKHHQQQQQNNSPACKGWLVGCFCLLVFVFYKIKQLSNLKSVWNSPWPVSPAANGPGRSRMRKWNWGYLLPGVSEYCWRTKFGAPGLHDSHFKSGGAGDQKLWFSVYLRPWGFSFREAGMLVGFKRVLL